MHTLRALLRSVLRFRYQVGPIIKILIFTVGCVSGLSVGGLTEFYPMVDIMILRKAHTPVSSLFILMDFFRIYLSYRFTPFAIP
jgi:hypothetical protein